MDICQTIRNCHIVTFHHDDDTLISVGIYLKDKERFATLCFQDPLLGCQHIVTTYEGADILTERIRRASILSDRR